MQCSWMDIYHRSIMKCSLTRMKVAHRQTQPCGLFEATIRCVHEHRGGLVGIVFREKQYTWRREYSDQCGCDDDEVDDDNITFHHTSQHYTYTYTYSYIYILLLTSYHDTIRVHRETLWLPQSRNATPVYSFPEVPLWYKPEDSFECL